MLSDAEWRELRAEPTPVGLYVKPHTSGWLSMVICRDIIDRQITAVKKRRSKKILVNYNSDSIGVPQDILRQLLGVVEGVRVQSYSKDIKFLENGSDRLEYLSVSPNARDTPRIDLLGFPNIRCISGHAESFENITQAYGLDDIKLWCNQGSSEISFSRLSKLRRLGLVGSWIHDAKVLSLPRSVKCIDFARMRNLVSIESFRSLGGSLVDVSLQSCPKLKDLSALSVCYGLKYLMLNRIGPVQSLSFCDSMQKLEFISFMDVDVADGKVRRLKKLEKLQYAAFDNKRHYDARFEEIAPAPPRLQVII